MPPPKTSSRLKPSEPSPKRPITFIILSTLLLCFAIFYQLIGHTIIFSIFGLGRWYQNSYEKISEFPYQCRRIYHPRLESCEDMVLDHEGGFLFAACSDVKGRKAWSPAAGDFNLAKRPLHDTITVLDITKPGPDGSYAPQALTITGDYVSSNGGKDINLHGMDIEVLSPTLTRLWIINHRPSVSLSGSYADQSKTGANSTIEVFEHVKGTSEMKFIKTIASEAIISPNDLVAVGNGGVLITNDFGSKVGMKRILDPIFGGGSITYCTLHTGKCHNASPYARHYFPNGITSSFSSPSLPKNLVFIANGLNGIISINILNATNPENVSLRKVNEVKLGMPIDNLSIDAQGNVFAACVPKPIPFIKGFDNNGISVPSTIFKITMEGLGKDREVGEKWTIGNAKMNGEGWEATKALEDSEGEVLPGSTIAVHYKHQLNMGVEEEGFWLGSIHAGFVTVCEGAKRPV